MKKISLSLFAGILCIATSVTFADDEKTDQSKSIKTSSDRFSIEVQSDSSGNYSPNFMFPINWSDNWYSSVSYIDSTQLTSTTLTGFAQSKDVLTIDDRRTGINLISYTNGNASLKYSVGLNYQDIAINKEEFGYFHLVLTSPATNSWVSFDNQVQIKSSEWALSGDVTLKDDNNSKYMLRIGAVVAPVSKLSVSQQTDFQPLVAISGTANSNVSQAPYWKLNLDGRYQITDWLSFGIDGHYEVLPMKYQVAQLSTSLNSFTLANENIVETTTRIGAKLIFKVPNLTLNPLLGIANQSVSDNDALANTTTTTTQTLLILGLTGAF